jgi:hypothetical protein
LNLLKSLSNKLRGHGVRAPIATVGPSIDTFNFQHPTPIKNCSSAFDSGQLSDCPHLAYKLHMHRGKALEYARRDAGSVNAGAKMFVNQAGAAFLLVSLTLWLQSAGIAALIAWVRHILKRDIYNMGLVRSAVFVVRFATAAIALHLLEILLWASYYRWLCFPSWESAFYFSASSYATVGYGDVTLPLKWRMLGPLESIIGVLMCGISVSLLFALAMRLVGPETQPT